MTKALVEQAQFQAVAIQRPPADLIHPSDRGSQYCSPRYQRLLKQFGMKASMSRRGNCYDNAPMESFWGTLKRELVHQRRYSTRQQAQQEIIEYIGISLQPSTALFPTALFIASGICTAVLQNTTGSMMRFMACTFDDRCQISGTQSRP